MITDPNQIGFEWIALHLAQSGSKRPVWIDVPLDVQNKVLDPDNFNQYIPETISDFIPSRDDINYLLDAQNAKRPAILIGSGVRSSEAIGELETFNLHPIPVTYSGSAPDSYGLDNKLSVGLGR